MNLKMNRKGCLACLLLTCWQLSGCTLGRYELGEPLDEAKLSRLAPQASLGQALQLLGPPVHMSATDSGYVMAWEHWQIREDALGLRLGALGADIINMDMGRMHVKGEFLLLTFNQQHVLSSTTLSHWDNYAGGGVGVQPFASFVDVVDADDLRNPMKQHRWGSALLKSMSKGQNRHSSPHTGQNGIEQRGTTQAIGQQSLEMD
jgi:hypothetical protein